MKKDLKKTVFNAGRWKKVLHTRSHRISLFSVSTATLINSFTNEELEGFVSY